MTDVFVGFIDSKVKEEYEKARSEDPQLFKFLERVLLQNNAQMRKYS